MEDKRDPVLAEDELSRNEDHAQFMFDYKTKPCEGYVWDCNKRQYHGVKERRRLLTNIRYTPEPCPNVLVGQKWGAPNVHCRDERFIMICVLLFTLGNVAEIGLILSFAGNRRNGDAPWHIRRTRLHTTL